LGNYFDEYLEVLDGLLEGDRVVSSAQFLLDSESSIHSDFKRMEAPENNDGMQVPSMQMDTEDNDETLSAWTNAVINEVMADERMLNLSHGPIDAFNMMSMTMNFMVADSIDMSTLQEGTSLHIQVFRNDSGMFEVIELHVLDEAHNLEFDMNHEMGDHS
jgi:Cu(I)/Ag(I) efflux system membrane fusion protein